jgi:hypothetical protein
MAAIHTFLCERRASRFSGVKMLKRLIYRISGAGNLQHLQRRNCRWRQILPGCLRLINHKGPPSHAEAA